MAKSNQGKDYSTYVKLKVLIHAKSIKTIANWHYFELNAGVLCQRKLNTIK